MYGIRAVLTAPITQRRRDRRSVDSRYQINTPNGAPPGPKAPRPQRIPLPTVLPAARSFHRSRRLACQTA